MPIQWTVKGFLKSFVNSNIISKEKKKNFFENFHKELLQFRNFEEMHKMKYFLNYLKVKLNNFKLIVLCLHE